MKTKVHMARPEHEVAYQELVALIAKHATKMTPLEILAVAANAVGKIIALQDQRATTPEMALEVVKANIEFGNETVLNNLKVSTGGRA